MLGISKKMTWMTTYRPDYSKAQLLAYKTLKNSKEKQLPISVKRIIKKFPDLHIQSYTTFSKKRGLTIEQTCEYLDSEEGCLWMRKDKTYIIFYNDTIKNKARIRFTLAHELGHYILKHNEISDKTKFMRYSLSDNEYDIFEKEANYFAKRLLAPLPIINAILDKNNSIEAKNLEEIFGVSFLVATYLYEEITKRKNFTYISRKINDLVLNFKHELELLNLKKCIVCDSEINTDYIFCPFCGESRFIQVIDYGFKSYREERNTIMIYSKIDTDQNGNLFICPRCSAENLDDSFQYCPYCSIYLHNVCLGREEDKYIETMDGEIELSIKERHTKNSCSVNLLDGGFRYCPDCGNKTSFYAQKLLNDWYDEQQQSIDLFSQKEFTELPF